MDPAFLRCPNCHGSLSRSESVLACTLGHRFDIARQGYVTLLAPGARPAPGDGAAMVQSRSRILEAGIFAPIQRALDDALPAQARRLADFGAGPGHYLAHVLEGRPQASGVALEASRPALARAAACSDRITAVGCDIWRELPLRDNVVDAAICVFSPRNGAELGRVLAPQGTLLVVAPLPHHLNELAARVDMLRVPEGKDAHVRDALAPTLELAGQRRLEYTVELERAQAIDVVLMGPNGHHLEAAQTGSSLPESITVTVAVTLQTYRSGSNARSGSA